MIARDKALKYLRLARHQAELFSKDPSTKVGCIMLAPGSLQVLSLGYNGMPRGIDERRPERWERPIKYRYVEHAERNCIYNACRHGTPLEGAVAVVTLFPCVDCARALIQSGVRQLVSVQPDPDCARWGDDHRFALDLLTEAGMSLLLFDDE